MPQDLSRNEMTYHSLPLKNILSFLADKEPFALLETTRYDPKNFFSYIFCEPAGKIEINKVTPDGWKQTLAVLTAGNFFGELSILEKRKHEANAAAIEKSELLKLSKEDFEKLEKEDVALASKILKKLALVMSKNLRRMNEKFLNALINY